MNVLTRLREATEGSQYEGRLYLVGGVVRDKVMGLPQLFGGPSEPEDIDIVLEGDAAELASFLHEKGLAEHYPVIYPKFGTAMVTVDGVQVELVSARAESYQPHSRKPEVRLASLRDDILRRDFTINTLLENLHTGETLDLLECARADIARGIIRAPAAPEAAFDDDPLRMLRAVRFAARFGFSIEQGTYDAIKREVGRLSIVSKERIRDELTKILASPNAAKGLELLLETGLLSQFAPELAAMSGVGQNIYHLYDCWTHTLKVIEELPPDSGLLLRLAALFHDVGKPETRTTDEQSGVHFYGHQSIGADITRRVMGRLRFSNEQTDRVSKIVSMHLRVGEYDSGWSDAAIRRLIRDAGDLLPDLVTLTAADKAASNTEMPSVDLDEFQRRVDAVLAVADVAAMKSPLDGKEIMDLLGAPPGPALREAKDFLTNEVIEGRLAPGDKTAAGKLLLERFGQGQ